MPAGRPSAYDPAKLEEVENYCLLGCTDEQLSNFLEISVETLYGWKRDKPEFLQAIKKGKEIADSLVAKSLFQKAILGDTLACIYWLKNRRPEKWREKPEPIEEGAFQVEIEEVSSSDQVKDVENG